MHMRALTGGDVAQEVGARLLQRVAHALQHLLRDAGVASDVVDDGVGGLDQPVHQHIALLVNQRHARQLVPLHRHTHLAV